MVKETECHHQLFEKGRVWLDVAGYAKGKVVLAVRHVSPQKPTEPAAL